MIATLTSWINTSITSIRRGFRLALRHPVLILLKWLTGLMAAYLMVAPVMALLGSLLDHTVVRESLSQAMGIDWLREFQRLNRPALDTLSFYHGALVIAFFTLHLGLSGGVFSTLWSGSLNLRQFLNACLGHFWAMIQAAFFCMLLSLLIVAAPMALLASGVQYLADQGWSLSSCFWVWWVSFAFMMIFPLSLVARVFEYTRLLACVPADHPMAGRATVLCFWRGCLFTARHHVPTFIILASFFLMGPLLIWAYQLALSSITVESNVFWWELALGQLLLLMRILVSLAAHGAHLYFLQTHLVLPQQAVPDKAPPADEAGEKQRYTLWQDDEDMPEEEGTAAVDTAADDSAVDHSGAEVAERDTDRDAGAKTSVIWEPEEK